MWLLACFTVLLVVSQSAECAWGSCSELATASSGFDTAIRSPHSPAILYLLQDELPFQLLSPLDLTYNLAIQGNRQTLLLGQKITIALELHVFNATLKNVNTDIQAAVVIRGGVLIQRCSIEGFSIPLFEVLGKLEMISSKVSRSSEIVIKGFAYSEISLVEVEVDRHEGAFLDCDRRLGAMIKVSISACTFRNNISRNTESLLTLTGTSLTLSLLSSHFLSNSIPLLYFDIRDFKAVITNCTFSSNGGTNMAGYVRESLLEVSNCTWSDNSEILLDLKELSGSFTFKLCAISGQTKKGTLQVFGSSSAGCYFSLLDSRLFDSAIAANDVTPGAVYTFYCSIAISNTSIEDFVVAASEFMQVKGLIAFQFSTLTIANLQVRRSGTSDACLVGTVSTIHLYNATFYRSLTGQNLVIGVNIGEMLISNLTIIDQEPHDFGRPFMATTVPTLIGVISVNCSFADIHISQSVRFRFNIPFAVGYSNFKVSGVKIEGQDFAGLIGVGSSSGTFSNLLLADSYIPNPAITVVRNSDAHIANFTIVRTIFESLALIKLSSDSLLSAENLTFDEMTAKQFISSQHSTFSGTNIEIRKSSLFSLALNLYSAQLTFTRLHVVQSRLNMFEVVKGNVTLVNCTFQEVVGDGTLFEVQTSSVTLLNCTFRNITSKGKFGTFSESSLFSIAESAFNKMIALDGEGFKIADGFLNITNSQFSQYSAALFQAVSSAVTIHDSSFRDGVNSIQILSSNLAYGGVLGCASCWTVDIRRISVFNVAAMAGGAIAVRLTGITLSSALFLDGGKFTSCRADYGGALYVDNTFATIKNSIFTANSAQKAGGGLFVNVRTIDSNSITNCTFEGNTAYEGGAIKLRNALANMKKCRYIDNSAYYGADIASYGVELSSRLTNISQVYVSGTSLTIAFELLDHYGNRVKTATSLYLTLLSGNVHYRGNNVSFVSEGIFHFPELTVYALPNSIQAIIGEMNDTQGDFKIHAIGTAALTFRDCIAGEIRREDRCEYCYSGTVSYSPLDPNCTYCPKHAFCPGGTQLTADSGYWRKSRNTTTLLRCPLEDNCKGGESSNCTEGYTGLLCNECDDGFYRFRTVECENCLHIAAVWVQVLLPIILIALFIYATLKYSHRTKEDERYKLKTAIHHSQFLAAMCPLAFSLPPILKNSLHALTYVSSLQLSDLPFDCFGYSSPEFARALAASLLLPSLILIFFIVSYWITKEWKKQTLVLSSTALLFTPTVVMSCTIPLLICQRVDSSEEWLFLDMSQECWTSSHKLIIFALAIPSLILNILVPLTAVILLAILHPSAFDESCVMWRSGYRYRCWDLLFVLSKVMCFGLLTATIDGNKLNQLTYGLLVFLIVSIINVSSVDVYLTHRLFYLSEASLVVTSVSMGLCASYTYSSPGPEVRDSIICGIFLLLNCGFFFMCAVFPTSVLVKTDKAERKIYINPPPNSFASSDRSFST